MHTVTLRNGKQFIVEDNASILDAAQSAHLALQHSCRTGRCGICKAKILSGKTRRLKAEDGLSNEEVADGIILTCCHTVSSDVRLDIEDVAQLAALEIKTLPCRIDDLTRVATDVVKVVLRLPPGAEFNFLPGQYIDLIAKPDLRRSYSIANKPNRDGKIELYIKKVESGKMSHYWFCDAKVNDLLRFEGPFGSFVLRELPQTHVIFFATGTGISPVKAMLEEFASNPEAIRNKEIRVYWGGRHKEDIYWVPEFGDFECVFIPVLSRPMSDWGGRQGYVQEAFIEDNIPLDDAVVYACGSVDMIRSAQNLLSEKGLSAGSFYSDVFVNSN